MKVSITSSLIRVKFYKKSVFILNKYVTLSYLKSVVSVEIFKNETTTDSIHRRIVEVLHGLWSNS